MEKKSFLKYIVFPLMAALLFIVLVSDYAESAGVNLLANGDFEQGQTGWTSGAFNPAAVMTVDTTQHYAGTKSVKISSSVPNDARWEQTVYVRPYTNYRLSGRIKTDTVVHSDGVIHAGANLCLYGTWTYTAGLYGTNDWTYVSLDFNSGFNTQVTIAARLGYWSGVVTGTAWFDDLKLEGEPPQTAMAVWPEFLNSLKDYPGTNPDVTVSTSAVFFGGHVSEVAQAPQAPGGGYKLTSSSFGQMVANTIPFPGFEQAAIDQSKQMLYADVPNARADAAFRYKVLLYGPDVNGVTAQFQQMANYWTETEQGLASDAAKIVREALKYNPLDLGLRKALLDIYYDTAIANKVMANEKMVDVQKKVLGMGYIPPANEFFIDKEIALMEAVLPFYDDAIRPYFVDLLKDPMGVDMNRVNSTAAAQKMPFGYYIFQTDVPLRSMYASSYKDQSVYKDVISGQPVDSTHPGTLLFGGYKDIVLLFELERDAARAAAKLAKLYAMRANPGDYDKARKTIGEAQQKSYTDGTILNGIFGSSLNPDKSGLAEARGSWGQGMSALSGMKSFLDGNANPLGLDKNFLVLVPPAVQGAGRATYDSYDYFESKLIPDAGPANSLAYALEKYNIAKGNYDTVRLNRDALGVELEAHRGKYGDRLAAIAGAPYGTSSYLTPETNQGSQIYIQLQSIESAKLRIEHNAQEIKDLQKLILNEVNLKGKLATNNNLIEQTMIVYGTEQAELTRDIAKVSAAQAFANETAAAVSSFDITEDWGWGTSAHAVNAVIQSGAELIKGNLQAIKDEKAAAEQAAIHYLNAANVESEADKRIADLHVRELTLTIESSEAAILLAQEFGKLQALYDEKAYLETQWKEADSTLKDRYFADPSHRLKLDTSVIEADLAFDEAQLWVFIMARAAEYKWNSSFDHTFLNKTYTVDKVFALRNAKELEDMARAVKDWNGKRTFGQRMGDQFVKFSLKEDLLGYRSKDNLGHDLHYPDPVTGQMVDALTAFRSYLEYVAPRLRPLDHLTSFREVMHLEFSTAKPNRATTFFSPDRWNEKIKWVTVFLNATTYLEGTELMVWLEQSGTGLLRNQRRGQPDQGNPDILKNEMTSYPTSYWVTALDPDTGILTFVSRETSGFPINAFITEDPNTPIDSLRKTEFAESSPAVSRWILEIPTRDSGGYILWDFKFFNDVEIWFYNQYYTGRLSN